MPLTPLVSTSAAYFLRRPPGTGPVTGPFEAAAIAAMLADGRLTGAEEISTDRHTWVPARTLKIGPTGGAGSVRPAPAPSPGPPAPLNMGGLGDDSDGILLAPLEIGLAGDSGSHHPAPPGDRETGKRPTDSAGDLAGGPFAGEPSGFDGLDLGEALELVEREPVTPPKATAAAEGAARAEGRPTPPVVAPRGPAGGAAASFASLLESADVEQPPNQGHQPLRLDEILTAPAEVKPLVRPRTLTAARGGQPGIPVRARWRPTRRIIASAIAAAGLVTVVVAAVAYDLPDRLRGEPALDTVLGATGGSIAQDHFAAFSEGARLLEEAAGTRRHVTATRAAAAELLASSVVIHGGERGRIARAESLLEVKKEPAEPARSARARAFAWVALAKGRWKEAEQIAADTALALQEEDRAVLRGWAALGREDAARATQLFQAAVQAMTATPSPPHPSRVATLYALARAHEADLSALTEGAYRAVLVEAPTHVGAALGVARVSKLSAAGRLKLTEAVIAQQTRDASRLELAEGYALVARTAGELGAADKVEAALKRAHDVDPASAAAAVVAGDMLLADGRIEDAVARYKLTLAAPVSATRTSWFRFGRLAALIESGRRAEATAALADLEKRLPGDARVSFWRGRAAERAQPADTAAADQAYREALVRDPRFLPASLQLARLLLDQHRGADALAVLRRAEKQGAAAATLRVALGQALLGSGNAVEAARAFRQAIAADPKRTADAAHLGLASALEAQGDLEGARGELAALAARGDVPGLGTRVAAVLVKLDRKPEALAILQREIAAGTASGQTKVAAARLALELGRNDVTRALAQSAVDEDPRTPGALLVLAEVSRAAGDLAQALADLRRALAVDGSAEVQLEYGRALAALGRDEDALSALAQAQEIPQAAVERGRILLRRGDADGAGKLLAAATARLPHDGEAFLLLGEAEDRLGHAPRAEAAWRTAVKLTPDAPESRYRLGRLEMDRGHAAAALPHLRAAAEHLPARGQEDKPSAALSWRPDLFFQLGFAELRQGARERALAAFKRYLQVAPPEAPARAEVTRQLAALDSRR